MLILSMLWGRIAPVLRLVPWWAWLLAALLAWGAWQRHQATAQAQRAAQAEQAAAVHAATAQAERQAREQENTYADNARKAADVYRAQLEAAHRSAGAARAGLLGLRDAVASATACPASQGASAPSGIAGDAELRNVLNECGAALQTVAEAADSDAARLKGLQDYVKAIGAASATKGSP